MSGPGEGAGELERVLDELLEARLLPGDWAMIGVELQAVVEERGDTGHRPEAVHRLAQVTFEARIQQRFHGGRSATTLPPTKQTSALPWVGLVCGGVLLLVGGSLGGGPVFVGVALLGLFVFGIAMAGSRVAHRHVPTPDDGPSEAPVAMPEDVAVLVRRLRTGHR